MSVSSTQAHTNQKGTLGVEGVGATYVDESLVQKLEQTDVVVAVGLQRETNIQKKKNKFSTFRLSFFKMHVFIHEMFKSTVWVIYSIIKTFYTQSHI